MTIYPTINSKIKDINENERKSYREGVVGRDGGSGKVEEGNGREISQ